MTLSIFNDLEQAEEWRAVPGFGTTSRGEGGGNVKLTERQVREIRARHRAGETQQQLAAVFAVSSSQVSNICRSASWSHVKEGAA